MCVYCIYYLYVGVCVYKCDYVCVCVSKSRTQTGMWSAGICFAESVSPKSNIPALLQVGHAKQKYIIILHYHLYIDCILDYILHYIVHCILYDVM